jgi:hypothetical protein
MTMKTKHNESDATLDELLRWAARGKGWAFREYPPQRKTLAGGCELIVVVPVLWRGRITPRPTTPCERIEFPRARRKVG